MTNRPAVSDILPFDATEATLPNGLRVIIVPTGFPNLVSLQIPVQTGSRNEVEPGKSGFAHFFEHMMFRGTKRFPPDAYQAVLTRAGARQNAYTTDDYTNYHTTFAKEDLAAILEIEADRFQHLDYSEEAFRTEARTILGEYNKSAAEPLTKLFEVQREHAFRTHTYRHTVMGFLADIEAMPDQFDYSRLFFQRWYRPEYTTIVLAGDLEPGPTLDLVARLWGDWKTGNAAPIAIPQEPPPAGPVVAHVSWDVDTIPWLTTAFHAPAFSTTSPAFAAFDVLLDLAFGPTSDLYRELVEEKQVVDQFGPWLGAHVDPPLATIMSRVKRPEDVPFVLDRVLATAAALREVPPDTKRLDEARSNMRYGFARTLDNSETIAATLARYVHFERSYGTLNALFRAYDALTPADLLDAARTYLTDERLVVTTLAHGELPPLPASRLPLPVRAEPAPPPFPVIDLPSPSPLVRFKLLFNVGSAHDPAGREGLAALAAQMIASAGSAHLRYDEITRALFPIAGSFSAQVDREMTVFTGVIHRDNAGRFLDIVLPQLLEPGFREDDFARLHAVQQAALVQDLRSSNEEELAKERLQANIFAGTPYGHPSLGTVSGLRAITLDDVKTFVATSYTRANLVVGLTGDAAAGDRDALLARLAALPAGTPAPVPAIIARRPAGMEVDIVAKETRSVAISFGHPLDVTRAHPDFAALWLARSWLGEHRASHGHLFQRLREVRGLNYGNYAYIEAFPRGMYQFFPDTNIARRAQIFEVWVRPVAPQHAVFALKAAIWELRRLIDHGLTDDQFEATRDYLMKGVYQAVKTQDQQLGAALDARWYGTGDYVATLQDGLRALTRDAVNAAISRHLSGSDLAVVMVSGDPEGLRAELLSPAPTSIRYDAPKPPDVLAEDAAIGALDLGLTADRVRITPVEAVFA